MDDPGFVSMCMCATVQVCVSLTVCLSGDKEDGGYLVYLAKWFSSLVCAVHALWAAGFNIPSEENLYTLYQPIKTH